MKPPRGLSESEAAAWASLAAGVVPLHPAKPPVRAAAPATSSTPKSPPMTEALAVQPSSPGRRAAGHAPAKPLGAPPPPAPQQGLDSHWERRLRAGVLSPDFTIDLHEHTLDTAYQRLLGGIDIARETGGRVVLVIAGRVRPTHAADRAGARGAIRAKLLDWLAASRHAGAIASIRNAHRRHGGEGALYVILKKAR